MLKYIIFFLAFLCSIQLKAQLSAEQHELLRTEIFKKVNNLRSTKRRAPLKYNDTLKQAAILHSNYMAKKNRMTHYQATSKLRTPKARILYCKGTDFYLFGENVLFIEVSASKISDKEVKQLAEDMFQLWKHSRSHYKNMLDKGFELSHLAFKMNLKNNFVYATQVFGSK